MTPHTSNIHSESEPSGGWKRPFEKALDFVHRFEKLHSLWLVAIQPGYLHIKIYINEAHVPFLAPFLFTFPLTMAIAVSVMLVRLLTGGLSSSLKIIIWLGMFGIFSGWFAGVGESFVKKTVPQVMYSNTLVYMGANNPEFVNAQLRQTVDTLSKFTWLGMGQGLASLVESAYVYGFGNFVFSLIIGLLLGWLCSSALMRYLNRVPAAANAPPPQHKSQGGGHVHKR
jgi:hypothetical protein